MVTSIYLAKSNRANPDHVMAVRNILSRFDVEIVEFKGGGYSHKPLLGCDMLIVVPELSGAFDEIGGWVDVGRGLFEQVEAFSSENNKCDMLIINSYHESTKELGLGDFEGFEVADADDYVNYGSICFKDTVLGSLSQVLENRLSPTKENSTKVSTKRSRYRLLLTSK